MSTAMETVDPKSYATILCCLCGTPIAPNPSNTCVNCIRSQVDLSEGIPKQCSLLYCRFCGRYLSPPKTWMTAELESKELMALCLRRIKRLNKLKLVDAAFVWTEPHSRRIRVKLTVQGEVLHNTILQQSFVVEFVVELQQCVDCQREAAKMDAWQAVVQVRQKVEHKRTFYYLEQLILKHNAHENALGIRQQTDGIDVYFLQRSHALSFLAFLNTTVCVRQKHSDHLVSHDLNNNTYRYKYTFSAEIAPLCKDDLVCLPRRVAAQLGGIGPLVLVHRVSNWIGLVDPFTTRWQSIDTAFYWRHQLRPLLSSRRLVEYVVLDIEPLRPEMVPGAAVDSRGESKFWMAEAVLARSSDLGANDQQFTVRTHLGKWLKPGDLALGYDLATANVNDDGVAEMLGGVGGEDAAHLLPDVVLVRKTYPRKNRARRRKWMLRELPMERQEEPAGRGGQRERQAALARETEEREAFMQELEQDPEMRATIRLYRDPSVNVEEELEALKIRYAGDRKWTAAERAAGQTRRNAASVHVETTARKNNNVFGALPEDGEEGREATGALNETASAANDDDDDAGYPEVPLDELLDGLELDTASDAEGRAAASPSWERDK